MLNALLIVLCGLAAESSQPAPAVWPSVVRALENDAALLENHRGYLAYLAKRPEINRAEAAFDEILLVTRFRRLARAFDEALLRNADAQAVFDQHYDEQARTAALETPDTPKALAFADSAANAAWRALAEHFDAYPHRFQLWQERHLAWAADAQARAWCAYWRRRIWRAPDLGVAYLAYLQRMRQRPEEAQAAEQRWLAQFGPAPEWPPKTAPPALASTTSDPVFPPDREQLMPDRPQTPRPEISRPAKPAMPQMPRKPERPTMRTP